MDLTKGVDWNKVDDVLEKNNMAFIKPYLVQFYEQGVKEGAESAAQLSCGCLKARNLPPPSITE